MEKLYTVEEIANMLSLTTRTIRNYLKDGNLKGRKIGGQWRFTEEELKNFMDNAAFATDLFNQRKQDVLDFIDGVNTDITAEFQTCTIIDIYEERANAESRRDKAIEFINSSSIPSTEKQSNFMRFTWEYIENESKARILLFASPNNLLEIVKILQENK
jgi:excisionase family DNA binding protein